MNITTKPVKIGILLAASAEGTPRDERPCMVVIQGNEDKINLSTSGKFGDIQALIELAWADLLVADMQSVLPELTEKLPDVEVKETAVDDAVVDFDFDEDLY